jgi:hypothetical protein
MAGVSGTGIRRAERVKLLDGAVGVDHDQRARQEPDALYLAGMAEDELDELTEKADPRLLARRAVPALEDADEPVSVPGRGRTGTPVGVRQQQVNDRRGELEQGLVRGDGVVLYVDRTQDAAVTLLELRTPQQVKSVGDRVEAAAPVGVPPVPPGRVRVTVQADAYADPQAFECRQHRAV